MITVHFSDGSTAQYSSRAEAIEGIAETVLGGDAETTVDRIETDDVNIAFSYN